MQNFKCHCCTKVPWPPENTDETTDPFCGVDKALLLFYLVVEMLWLTRRNRGWSFATHHQFLNYGTNTAVSLDKKAGKVYMCIKRCKVLEVLNHQTASQMNDKISSLTVGRCGGFTVTRTLRWMSSCVLDEMQVIDVYF